eukprot:1415972-Amphidinium_carterae.1
MHGNLGPRGCCSWWCPRHREWLVLLSTKGEGEPVAELEWSYSSRGWHLDLRYLDCKARRELGAAVRVAVTQRRSDLLQPLMEVAEHGMHGKKQQWMSACCIGPKG